MIEIVTGEKLKKIRFHLTQIDPDTGLEADLDITGCTLQAKYSIAGGSTKTEDLTIVSATEGTAEFRSKADGSSWDAVGIVVGRVYIMSSTRLGIAPKHWYAEVIAA